MLRWAYKKIVPLETRKRWYTERELKRVNREFRQFPKYVNAPRHTLLAPLVVSVTSYPPRFPTVHCTLKSLLDQTVKPDHVIFWVAEDDVAQLPADVTALESFGLEIRTFSDIRSHKKIIPSLLQHPNAFIVTVDDDTYYEHDWLEKLIDFYDAAQPTIVCYRAHRLRYDEDGSLAPYYSWDFDVTDEQASSPSRDLLPTGNAGVLYPPGSLHPDVTDIGLLTRLSPTSDDVWLFFMWQRAGWSVKRIPGPKFNWPVWPGTRSASLYTFHQGGTKDKHLRDMCAEFGTPGVDLS